jgi:hypothetical protein
MLFTTTGLGGKASLDFDTPLAGRGLQVVEVLLWLAAIAVLVVDQRRRPDTPPAPEESLEPEPSEPAPSLIALAGGHRKPRRVSVPDTGDEDELWE